MLLKERKNNPISSYTNIKFQFLRWLAFLSYLTKSFAHSAIAERENEMILFLPSHINSQFSPFFPIIMFINKKGVYRFLVLLLVRNCKEIPADIC